MMAQSLHEGESADARRPYAGSYSAPCRATSGTCSASGPRGTAGSADRPCHCAAGTVERGSTSR
jgi:hypothetical protein